jgi:hypothetical protein
MGSFSGNIPLSLAFVVRKIIEHFPYLFNYIHPKLTERNGNLKKHIVNVRCDALNML